MLHETPFEKFTHVHVYLSVAFTLVQLHDPTAKQRDTPVQKLQ